MAKLYFRYSTMNAGKSGNLLMVSHNYEERGNKALILTSSMDTRYGVNRVTSRIGVSKDAIGISKDDDVYKIISYRDEHDTGIDCVLVDEVQFFTAEQIVQLTEVVDQLDIPVICYGLRSDFTMNPFEASAKLMAVADTIEEIKTVCWCGKKATVNARVVNGKIQKEGDQVQIGGNESYVALCRKHYKERKISI